MAEVAEARAAGLARMSACELGDEINAAWRSLTGRSVHMDEGAVRVVERDRMGRIVRHQIEGVTA